MDDEEPTYDYEPNSYEPNIEAAFTADKKKDRQFSAILAEENLKHIKAQKEGVRALEEALKEPVEPVPDIEGKTKGEIEVNRLISLKDKDDYIGVLGLSKPYLDPLDRLAWDPTKEDINRAFRKVSFLYDQVSQCLAKTFCFTESSILPQRQKPIRRS